MQSWILLLTETRTCEGQVSKSHFKHTVWLPLTELFLFSQSQILLQSRRFRKGSLLLAGHRCQGRGKTPAWSQSSFNWLMTRLVRCQPFSFTNLSTRGHLSKVPLATLFLTENLSLKVKTFFKGLAGNDLFPGELILQLTFHFQVLANLANDSPESTFAIHFFSSNSY